jgi:hypothetical protein
MIARSGNHADLVFQLHHDHGVARIGVADMFQQRNIGADVGFEILIRMYRQDFEGPLPSGVWARGKRA